MTMTPEQRAWRRQGKARCIAKARALLGGPKPKSRSPGGSPPLTGGYRGTGTIDPATVIPPSPGGVLPACPHCGASIAPAPRRPAPSNRLVGEASQRVKGYSP
jgi:hypothetical protein